MAGRLGRAHLQPRGINIIRAHLQIACIVSRAWCLCARVGVCVYLHLSPHSSTFPLLLFWMAYNSNNNSNKICSSCINSKNSALFASMLLLIISANDARTFLPNVCHLFVVWYIFYCLFLLECLRIWFNDEAHFITIAVCYACTDVNVNACSISLKLISDNKNSRVASNLRPPECVCSTWNSSKNGKCRITQSTSKYGNAIRLSHHKHLLVGVSFCRILCLLKWNCIRKCFKCSQSRIRS